MRSLIIVAAIAIVGCHQGPPSIVVTHVPDRGPVPPPSPVALPGDDLKATCATLDRAHCPEAGPDSAGDDCPTHLAKIRAERVVIPTVCVVSKTTPEEIRTCGDTSTLRFRCFK